MKKLALIVVVFSIASCSVETITNNTTTINNYYYGKMDSVNAPKFKMPPWKEKDSTVVIGSI